MMLTTIKKFITAPWKLWEYEREIAILKQDCRALTAQRDKARQQAVAVPSFAAVALRDLELGSEIAHEARVRAVEALAPALSREYMRTLEQIAFKAPPRHEPGAYEAAVLTAMDMKSRVVQVRVELPALSFDINVATL